MYHYQSQVRLGQVALNVVNLELESQYYQEVLGLSVLEENSKSIGLGIKETNEVLVRLNKVESEQHEAYGLYHLAILLPSRADLGDFLNHVIKHQYPLVGAADHGYSESIYLQDLEGNGIEVYRDKAVEEWDIQGEKIIGVTEQIDAAGVIDSAHLMQENYEMPAGTRMGHVHLTVQSAAQDSIFYQQLFNMTEKFAVPSASWISSGHYHHHFAFNDWSGPYLEKNNAAWPGLLEFDVFVDQVTYFNEIKAYAEGKNALIQATDHQLTILDPVGNRIIVILE